LAPVIRSRLKSGDLRILPPKPATHPRARQKVSFYRLRLGLSRETVIHVFPREMPLIAPANKLQR